MQRNVAPTAPSSPNAAVDGWCEVRAHQRVIRYRRIGDGPAPMLLLLDGDALTSHWPELTRTLSASFRVVVPDFEGGLDDAANVVRCLLDGLGALQD